MSIFDAYSNGGAYTMSFNSAIILSFKSLFICISSSGFGSVFSNNS